MWNQSQGDGYSQMQSTQPADSGDPYAEVTWGSDQLARMENEWRRLQRAFAYHPHVTLTPMTGDPPASYQVDFRLTTVIVNPRTNQLEYVANATVHVTLPPGFPNQAPTVKPMTAIFHPNVSYEGVYLENLWHPNETLLGLIRKIGDVLAYRSYDPDYAVNPAAMEWLTVNHAILPIDGQANLSPQAGGEPLDRICRYGPQSLESMKQSILATQSALFGTSAPDPLTLKNYATKTRMALNLFMESDVPEHLQAGASDLDEAARELVSMGPLYDFVRERRRRVAALRSAIKALGNAKANRKTRWPRSRSSRRPPSFSRCNSRCPSSSTTPRRSSRRSVPASKRSTSSCRRR
jgi:ubiquitin-protein ligase